MRGYVQLMKRYVVILFFMLFYTARALTLQSRAEGVVSIDLRDYGWQPPSNRYQHDGPSVAVDSKGRVVVGFTVQARGGLVTRNQPSLDYHVLRFTPKGKQEASLSIPTRLKASSSIYLSDTGQIIARANDSLQILEADDGDWQKGVWKMLCKEWCGVLQSPTRHTLILSAKGHPSYRIVCFSPEPVLQSCDKPPEYPDSNDRSIELHVRSITDAFTYSRSSDPKGTAYRWPICESDHGIALAQSFELVLNDEIFLATTITHRIGSFDRKLEVISLDGGVRFQPPMSKYESVAGEYLEREPIRSDSNGDRIAVHLVTQRGGNLSLDMGAHATARRIAVYDIGTGKETFSVAVNLRQRYGFDFALSPDGHRLAVLEDGMLRIVDLN